MADPDATLGEARDLAARLERELPLAEQRLADREHELAPLALAVERAPGDAAARRARDAALRLRREAEDHAVHLRAAIEGARVAVADAERAVVAAERERQAAQLRALAEERIALAEALDALFGALVTPCTRWVELSREIGTARPDLLPRIVAPWRLKSTMPVAVRRALGLGHGEAVARAVRGRSLAEIERDSAVVWGLLAAEAEAEQEIAA